MINSTTGKQIVRDAYESAAEKVREINSTNPYLAATAIAAGIMHTVLAMAAYTNEGEWSVIFDECKRCQADLLGRSNEAPQDNPSGAPLPDLRGSDDE